jgi:hypothetical protein
LPQPIKPAGQQDAGSSKKLKLAFARS